MGITVEQILNIAGQTLKFNPATDRADNICKFVCDSPRCSARHDGKATFLSWTEESARQDIYSLSDDYTGLIRINPNPWNMDETVIVCSPQCAKDFFTYVYARPKTPRQLKQESDERIAKLKINPEAQKAIRDSRQMELEFAVAPQIEPEADATGVSND